MGFNRLLNADTQHHRAAPPLMLRAGQREC